MADLCPTSCCTRDMTLEMLLMHDFTKQYFFWILYPAGTWLLYTDTKTILGYHFYKKKLNFCNVKCCLNQAAVQENIQMDNYLIKE